MKISRKQIRKIIKEYEQYVDEDGNVWDDEGNVTRKGAAFGRQYGGGTYGTNAPWQGGRSSSRYSSRRKTTHVGASANADKITAVEKALSAKSNNFLSSVLSQLKQGRGLSSKQKSIVKKILAKSSPGDAKLFEAIQGIALGPQNGQKFADIAVAGVADGDYRRAANAIMDSYWIDDVWPEEEAALVDMLSGLPHGADISQVEAVADEWITGKREGTWNPIVQGKKEHPAGLTPVHESNQAPGYEGWEDGDFVDAIRDYSKELTGRRNRYGDWDDLEALTMIELQDYYEAMLDSPEAQEHQAQRDREDQKFADSEVGYEEELHHLERSPLRQGMSHRQESTLRVTKKALREAINKGIQSLEFKLNSSKK